MQNIILNQVTRIFVFVLSVLFNHTVLAKAPSLCKAAAEAASYDTDYLDNFITLKEGKDGWLFRDTDLLDTFGPGKKGYQRLRYLNRLLNEHGTRLLMVPIPTRGITHPEMLGEINYDTKAGREAYIAHINHLRDIGIVVPKLESLFDTRYETPLFFSRDHHWTSFGAEQVAKVTADTIQHQEFYPEAEKQAFQTKRIGFFEIEGSHQKAAATICASSYNNETIDAYTTENISEMDLFGDVAEAQVVLVGTSNSNGKQDFNFSGYLMEYSRLDILNLAKSGAGYDGAILDYLSTDDFKQNPPKLLIWEVPGYYKLNSKTFYKKMVRLLKSEEHKQRLVNTEKNKREEMSQ